jgi:hypothetical protein
MLDEGLDSSAFDKDSELGTLLARNRMPVTRYPVFRWYLLTLLRWALFHRRMCYQKAVLPWLPGRQRT